MIKTILILLSMSVITYACPVYTTPIPIADVSVNIDSKKTKTSFSVVWEFKEELLSDHDKNNNKKFDEDEQQEIRDEYIAHLKSIDFMTEIVYVEKGQRTKKSLMQKIDIKNSKLTFSGMKIKYYYEFDTDIVFSKDHRLFIRFLDPSEKVNVTLKDVNIKNYIGKKIIKLQDIRANIYFYNYAKKYNSLKDTIFSIIGR